MAKRAEAIGEPRVPLSKDRVLRAAIEIGDKEGLEALTMRRLAQQLGVEAMSLYYHVANKDELLKGMVDLVAEEIEVPTGGADWKAAIRNSAISFHNALRRHRWATSLMTSGPPGVGPSQLRYSDTLLKRLREAGLSPDLTHHAYHALDSHVIGSTLWAAGVGAVMTRKPDFVEKFLRELPRDEFPYFAEHVDQHMTKSVPASGKSEFEFGLDLILDGLERMRSDSTRRAGTGSTVRRSPRRAPALASGRRSPRRAAATAVSTARRGRRSRD
jgi:AcrR family transcriptional regulator